MATTFHRPLNGVTTTVAAPRSAGADVVVATGTGTRFGSTFPLIATAARGDTDLCILEVTGRSGDTLTVSGAIEGTTDVALAIGDRVEMRATALAIVEVQDAVHAIEAIPPGAPGGSDTQVQYNSGGVLAGSAGFTFNAAAPSVRVTDASGNFGELNSNGGTGPTFTINTNMSGLGVYANMFGGFEAWLNFGNLSNSAGYRLCRYGTGPGSDAFRLDLLTDNGAAITSAGIVSFSLVAPAYSLVVDGSGVISGNGSGLTGITEGQVAGLVSDLAARAPLDAPTFTGTATIPVASMASHYGAITADTDATTITFNLATSDKHKVTLGGNRTLALSNVQVGQQFVLILVQDATGSRTVTWFSGITWMTAAGAVPALSSAANKINVFTFLCVSAGAYYGFLAGQNG